MARMSFEAQAKALAKTHGIELDDEGIAIEVYGYKAQLHNDAGGHLDFVHLEEYPTKAQQWKGVIDSLRMFIDDGKLAEGQTCECQEGS